MRISDWSSDVCSSDLPGRRASFALPPHSRSPSLAFLGRPGAEQPRQIAIARDDAEHRRGDGHEEDRDRGHGRRVAVAQGVEVLDRQCLPDEAAGHVGEEGIGRATGRGRVCEDGYTQVVYVELKKNMSYIKFTMLL